MTNKTPIIFSPIEDLYTSEMLELISLTIGTEAETLFDKQAQQIGSYLAKELADDSFNRRDYDPVHKDIFLDSVKAIEQDTVLAVLTKPGLELALQRFLHFRPLDLFLYILYIKEDNKLRLDGSDYSYELPETGYVITCEDCGKTETIDLSDLDNIKEVSVSSYGYATVFLNVDYTIQVNLPNNLSAVYLQDSQCLVSLDKTDLTRHGYDYSKLTFAEFRTVAEEMKEYFLYCYEVFLSEILEEYVAHAKINPTETGNYTNAQIPLAITSNRFPRKVRPQVGSYKNLLPEG